MKRPLISAFCLAFCLLPRPSLADTGSSPIQNPDFEEEALEDGSPAGWKVGKNAIVKVVEGKQATGQRAVLLEAGYDALQQEMHLIDLPTKEIFISFEAKSDDEAPLGFKVGYYITEESGKRKWTDKTFIWNRKLESDYRSFQFRAQLPSNATGERFWFAFYRSKNEGTIVIDSVNIRISE